VSFTVGGCSLVEIKLNEDQLQNIQAIAKKLLCNPEDPRSAEYQRSLIRPSINWVFVVLACLFSLILTLLVFFVSKMCGLSVANSIFVSLVFLFVFFLLNVKHVTIKVIRIYQRYAPDSIRDKCRFEPSCSQYMVMVIQKYGFIKGLIMGIKRIRKCNSEGGGYDYP
jgi:putative membrane protein insertion efficiency factor